MSELYNTEILRWTTRISHQGRLSVPDKTVVKTSRICGSRLTLDVMLEDGVIVDFAQEVKACALGQATAAIVGQHVVGLDAGEFKAVKKQFTAMVAGENIDFPDKWHELSILSPVKDHPGRKGSVMLPFECLTDIFSL